LILRIFLSIQTAAVPFQFSCRRAWGRVNRAK
jgi:hypothetical protein